MRNIINLQLKPRITRALRENTCFAQEPISTCSTTKRMVKIVDSKYEKADLSAIIREAVEHWSFWSGNHHHDGHCHYLSYPKRIAQCVLSDFRELNERIVRKPYPIPKISTILQKLEGFTYATTLDLIMGYYTIRLDPMASEMCTIIFPWGKYSYKRLPMGFRGSADIFQAQIMDLMTSLEFVQAYMNDLLIIMRQTLDKHLQKMETVLIRLRDAGFKVNAAKSSFFAHEIEYLGYILTREGIKPQPKKCKQYLH
jgi:hypothetical protein